MLKDNDYWLVLGDKLVIAHERSRKVSVDLYRNLKDYKEDKPMVTNQEIDLVIPSHSV